MANETPSAGGAEERDGAGRAPPDSSAPPVPDSPTPLTAADVAYARQRELMVRELASPLNEAPITDQRVLNALRRVPRHEFVPEAYRAQSYDNAPLPIGQGQTISQPYIVGLMTQLLDLDGHERVLEVGTGSGYQAAVLGELAGEVYTIEIRPELLESARRRLEELKAHGVLHWKKLTAIVGDGWKGYPPGAPYDAIVVTAAPREVPQALIDQLKPGGLLVIPVGDFFQELKLIRKLVDGSTDEKSIVPVRFVPLVDDPRK